MEVTPILRHTLEYAKLSQFYPQDDRSVLRSQPRFVLASEWPCDREDSPNDCSKWRAQKMVRKYDALAYEVLPEGHNRTVSLEPRTNLTREPGYIDPWKIW